MDNCYLDIVPRHRDIVWLRRHTFRQAHETLSCLYWLLILYRVTIANDEDLERLDPRGIPRLSAKAVIGTLFPENLAENTF